MCIPKKSHFTVCHLMLALLLLFVVNTSEAFGQINHNVTHSNKTQPVAGSGVDNDCDGACAQAPSLRGSLHVSGDSVLLFIDQEGRAPVPVPLTAASNAPAQAADVNSSRSNKGRAAKLDPTPIYLSINDAAFVSDPNPAFDIAFELIPPREARTSGVRQHAPFKVRAAFDKSTPFLQRSAGMQQLAFRVEGLAPGTYGVVVSDHQGRKHSGHVTLLK